jgi:hypothetical protein
MVEREPAAPQAGFAGSAGFAVSAGFFVRFV